MSKQGKVYEPKIRYEIEIKGDGDERLKCFLSPLTFAVAEVAMGYVFSDPPLYLTAGEVILNSLFVKGSTKLQKGGKYHKDAALKASSVLYTISSKTDPEDPEKTIVISEDKAYSFKLKEVDRDTLEDALGLIQPLKGKPRALTAGKLILENCWAEGDKKEIFSNDELLIPACFKAYEKVKVRTGTLKKL